MADPAVIGAAAALGGVALTQLANALNERRRVGREQATRWDKDLAGSAGEYVATARRLLHTARRVARSPKGTAPALVRLDELHEDLRALAPQVALLGSYDVQFAARHILRHAYAVQLVGQGELDPRPLEPPGPPDSRLEFWLKRFEVAVRQQLKVPDPTAVVDEAIFQ